MSRLYKLTLLLIGVLCVLFYAALALSRGDGPALSQSLVDAHGSDGTLRVGDYLLLYGRPLTEDWTLDGVDIWWPGFEIDVSAVNVGPWSPVLYTNQDQIGGGDWRGFRSRP